MDVDQPLPATVTALKDFCKKMYQEEYKKSQSPPKKQGKGKRGEQKPKGKGKGKSSQGGKHSGKSKKKQN
jgi:hypothetical protein